MNRYDFALCMEPVWTGNRVYFESIFPVKQAPGAEEEIPLLYHASRIVDVYSATLCTRYTEGRDYRLKDGKLLVPSGSAIPVMTKEEYYPERVEKDKSFWRKGGGYIVFSPFEYLHTCQAVLTYEHEDPWNGPVPKRKLDNLPKLKERLRNSLPVKVLFYGDSITCGYNSSGKVKVDPHLPDWTLLVMDALKQDWPAVPFDYVNTAVGGKSSGWAVENAAERAADHTPDLAVIAFGMNDGSGSGRTTPEQFKNNIVSVMNAVLSKNPFCEFLLLATSLANPEVLSFNERQREGGEDPGVMDHRSFAWNQGALLPALLSLEREGVVVADMTTLHGHILKRKRFHDMSGNNVNHPNDFFARIHAQLIMTTLR